MNYKEINRSGIWESRE